MKIEINKNSEVDLSLTIMAVYTWTVPHKGDEFGFFWGNHESSELSNKKRG